jgi:hypothetical protein
MPSEHDAAELRRRALELRRLAAHLAATPLDDLAAWAGPETWVSPRAAALRDQLTVERARLLNAVDDLRLHARWLEREADALEAIGAVAAAAGR